MYKGYWIPVLHSHLPFVKHPEYDYFLEEHWLFEAINECYIPLMIQMRKMVQENIDFRLCISITPPLAEMFKDSLLMSKYQKHLDQLIQLTQKELIRVKNESEELKNIAKFYHERFLGIREFFIHFLDRNLLNGYNYFKNLGKIEIITCGATHGFLPLLSQNKKAVEAQIAIAVASHKENFGESPKGIWLPECAYYDGVDEILAKYDIEFFFMDSHGVELANPPSLHKTHLPIKTKRGVSIFARDESSSKKVWSSKEGYPGDANYRDFYRDVGYDADYEYIKDYISPDGKRVFTGLKYHKVTGESDYKEIYNPSIASKKTKEHAYNFHFERDKQFEELNKKMDKTPIIVSPYDAELFGHWWFEGPEFLYNLFKVIDRYGVIKPLTPIEYLKQESDIQISQPIPSSWGDGGYYDVWLNETNDWIYRHLHFMADRFEFLSKNYINKRVLNQLLRELLLAQSSDWAFLMTTKTATEYSTRRTKEHIENFNKLSNMLENQNIDSEFLEWLEEKNSIFKNLDYKVYC